MTAPLDSPDWGGTSQPATVAVRTMGGIALGAGAQTTILAGVAGVSVRIFALTICSVDTGGGQVNVEGTDGSAIYTWPRNGKGFIYVDMHGLTLPQGVGIRLHNYGGTAMTQNDTYWILTQS